MSAATSRAVEFSFIEGSASPADHRGGDFGIDLRWPLSTELRDQIKAALLEYKVVFFRDQHLDREQQVAFAQQFGPIYTPPYVAVKPINGAPGLHLIAATKELNERLAAQRSEYWRGFHSDTNWRLVPSWGAVLRAVDLAPVGGDTIWVDAGLAYGGLQDDVKARLEGLFATVDSATKSSRRATITRLSPIRSCGLIVKRGKRSFGSISARSPTSSA